MTEKDKREMPARDEFAVLYAELDQPDARATIQLVREMHRDISAVSEVARLAGPAEALVPTFFTT